MRVPFAGVRREKITHYRLPRQRRQRHRSDELLAVGRNHNLHLRPGFHQKPEQKHTLVSRDTATYAEYYMFSGKIVHFFILSFTRVNAFLVLLAKSPPMIQL